MTQPIERDAIYRRRRFPREVIEGCVRWYLTYRLSYRDLVTLMAEWDVHVSHTTIMRWVFRYVPEYERRWNRRAKPVGSSWRMDETYIQTRPTTGYLYRAVDKQGKTVESLFQTSRGIAAAMAFFPQGGRILRAALAEQDHTRWAPAESLGAAPAPSRRSAVDIRPGSQLPVLEQYRRAGPPGDQAPLPADVGLQVLSDRRRDADGHRARASDRQAAVQVRTGPVELLVAEEAMGCGLVVSLSVPIPR